MEVEDFFPSYVPRTDGSLIDDLYQRTELNTFKLGPVEEIPIRGTGRLLNTQQILQRIMSPYTPYPHLLVDHGMGTGKTCTSVSIAEAWLAFRERIAKLATIGVSQIALPKRRVFVLVKSDNIRDNFVRDLANTCTDGRYQPPSDPTMTDKKLKIRTKKLYSENYEIATFETFSREILHNIHKPEFVELYSNRLIIIDEAHNLHPTSLAASIYAEYDRVVRESGLDVNELRTVENSTEKYLENYLKGGILYPHYEALANVLALDKGKKADERKPPKQIVKEYVKENLPNLDKFEDQVTNTLLECLVNEVAPHDTLNMYGRIHTFLHEIRSPRILLLSGTPMVDQDSEIVDLFNLILPLDNQMDKNKPLLKQISRVAGLTSYLEQMVTDVKREDIGTTYHTEHVKVVELEMSSHQQKGYEKAYRGDSGSKDGNEGDETGSVAWQNSRQASNFVFPSGKYGKEGFAEIKDKTARESFNKEVKKNLGLYSAKLEFIMDKLEEVPDECAFVFCRDIEGGGVNTIRAVFEAFGWTEATGNEAKSGKRFAVITGSTKNTDKLLRVYNSPENYDGNRIRVIIGSEAAAEALSFYHTTSVFLYTPLWNTSKLEQAIYRAIRVGSHNVLKKRLAENKDKRKISVKVYRLATVPSDADKSIELHMYQVAEQKDLAIMKVQRILKETAIDCELFKGRNLLESDVDGSRKCNYTTCEYTCKTNKANKSYNQNTHTIYYSTDLQAKIHTDIMEKLVADYQVDLDSIYSKYSKNPIVVDIVITNILTQYIILKIGIFEYQLALVGNTISLLPVHDNKQQAGYDLVAYTSNPVLQLQVSMNDLIQKQNFQRDAQILSSFRTTQKKELLDQISNSTLYRLLKELLSKKDKLDKSGKLIQSHFTGKGLLNIKENTFKVGETHYRLEGGKTEVVKKEKKQAKTVTVTDKMRKEKGDYFGYIKEGNLYVMDFTQKSSKGRNCNSKDIVELLLLLEKLGVEPLSVDTKKPKELAERLDGLKGGTFKMLENDNYKKYTVRQLQVMLTHYAPKTSKKTDETICNKLIAALKENDLLLDYEE